MAVQDPGPSIVEDQVTCWSPMSPSHLGAPPPSPRPPQYVAPIRARASEFLMQQQRDPFAQAGRPRPKQAIPLSATDSRLNAQPHRCFMQKRVHLQGGGFNASTLDRHVTHAAPFRIHDCVLELVKVHSTFAEARVPAAPAACPGAIYDFRPPIHAPVHNAVNRCKQAWPCTTRWVGFAQGGEPLHRTLRTVAAGWGRRCDCTIKTHIQKAWGLVNWRPLPLISLRSEAD